MIFALIYDPNKMDPVAGTFVDVDHGWYAQAINYLTRAGVLLGYGDGTFRPHQIISRAEMTALIARIFELNLVAGTSNFGDVSGHWASGYISAAYDRNMIQGRPDGSFDPNNAITRAEGVALFERAFGRTPDAWAIDAYLGGGLVFYDITPNHWAFYYIMSSALGELRQ
jgi:hypothetical protein